MCNIDDHDAMVRQILPGAWDKSKETIVYTEGISTEGTKTFTDNVHSVPIKQIVF